MIEAISFFFLGLWTFYWRTVLTQRLKTLIVGLHCTMLQSTVMVVHMWLNFCSRGIIISIVTHPVVV